MARPASPDYGSRVLERGVSNGRDVWELQIKLIGWGSGTDNDGIGSTNDPVRVNGVYDSTTSDAVARFQKAHGLPPTGVCDGNTFRTIDVEGQRRPVIMDDLMCPCVRGQNDGPILCRCTHHEQAGKCHGWGNRRFPGKFLLDVVTGLSGEKLDLYAMEEKDGIDKAVLWAVRALMQRASVSGIAIDAGYRCWHDNYHRTDDRRWQHRRSTLHLGKTIAFYNAAPGVCTRTGAAACPECERIRGVALAKCGFQLRWNEPDLVSLAEGRADAPGYSSPLAVHVDTARRKDAQRDDFVKTAADSLKPLYAGQVNAAHFPIDLGSGTDPLSVGSGDYFRLAETAAGGWFPVGSSRLWHGGVHLSANDGKNVLAIAEGMLVACRLGESETAQPLGSRNFVLVKHTWKKKTYFSLAMHLKAEATDATSAVPFIQRIAAKSVAHVEAIEPSPIYTLTGAAPDQRLVPTDSLLAGDLRATSGAELDPSTLDSTIPAGSKVIALAAPANSYVYTSRGTRAVATARPADAALAGKLSSNAIIGFADTFPIRSGELLGHVGPAAADASLSGLGSFFHFEIFSSEQLLKDGYTLIDAHDTAKVANRKEIVAALVAKRILAAPQDGVLKPDELKAIAQGPNRADLRSIVVKMPSTWSIEWKAALKSAAPFSFMADADRDALGDSFNLYSWWSDAKTAGAHLPEVPPFHYNPITFVLQVAYDTAP